MKEPALKRKVTAKLDYPGGNVSPRYNLPPRPPSPTKQTPQSSLSPTGFRTTVKVTSNATVRKLSSSASLKTFNKVNQPPFSASRPGSPLKQQVRSPPGPSLVTNPVKARVNARPPSKSAATSPVSSPSPLESRQRSSTTVSSNLRLPPKEDQHRSGSAALHHPQSSLPLQGTSLSSPSSELPFARADKGRASPSAPTKIKSKVSVLAKSNNVETEPVPLLSPPWASSKPLHTRPISSVSTNFSSHPSTAVSSVYPITIAAPAANPYRYPSPRRPPSPTFHPYQIFIPAEAPSKAPRQIRKAKVDPASIAPPHSPPISALSFSSKSSISRSSLLDCSPSNATASTVNSHTNKRSDTDFSRSNNVRSTRSDYDDTVSPKTNGRSSQDRDSDIDSGSSEHKARAAAKSNRKIADLEITNQSLLAINSSLETTKNRQAKEIRDLKRKLRESRLVLPPRAFRDVQSLDREEEGADDDDSEEGEGDAGDDIYARVKDMLEQLLESGRKALHRTSVDFRHSLPTKVLNADEVRTWRDLGQDFDPILDGHDGRDNMEDESAVPVSPSHVAVPDSDDDLSEDECRISQPLTPPPAHLPPITITPSSESS